MADPERGTESTPNGTLTFGVHVDNNQIRSLVSDVVDEVFGRSRGWSSSSTDTEARGMLRDLVRERVKVLRQTGVLATMVQEAVDKKVEQAVEEVAAEEARRSAKLARTANKKKREAAAG